MTDDIRERARGFLDRFVDDPTWDVYSPNAEQALVALLLAERAAALGAAGDVVRGEWQARSRSPEEERLEISSIQALERDVRSLSPEGWVGVREADLAVLVDVGEERAKELDEQVNEDNYDPETGTIDEDSAIAQQSAATIRVAIARLP